MKKTAMGKKPTMEATRKASKDRGRTARCLRMLGTTRKRCLTPPSLTNKEVKTKLPDDLDRLLADNAAARLASA